MDRRLWYAVIGLLAFGLLVAGWATRPWTDTKPLAPPPGVKQSVPPDIVHFQCGAPWGSASVHGPTSTPRPVVGTPCGQRDERRRLAAVDVAIAAVGVGYLSLGRPSRRHRAADVVVA